MFDYPARRGHAGHTHKQRAESPSKCRCTAQRACLNMWITNHCAAPSTNRPQHRPQSRRGSRNYPLIHRFRLSGSARAQTMRMVGHMNAPNRSMTSTIANAGTARHTTVSPISAARAVHQRSARTAQLKPAGNIRHHTKVRRIRWLLERTRQHTIWPRDDCLHGRPVRNRGVRADCRLGMAWRSGFSENH